MVEAFLVQAFRERLQVVLAMVSEWIWFVWFEPELMQIKRRNPLLHLLRRGHLDSRIRGRQGQLGQQRPLQAAAARQTAAAQAAAPGAQRGRTPAGSPPLGSPDISPCRTS